MPGGGVGVCEDDDVWEGVVVLDDVCQVGHHLVALERLSSDRVGRRKEGGQTLFMGVVRVPEDKVSGSASTR